MLRFALSGLIAVALLAISITQLVQRELTRASFADAKAVTRLAGDGIIAPQITPGLLAGDRREVARLDRLVRRRVLRAPIVRLKLWSPDGQVLYSDEPRLIGQRFALKDDAREALRTGRISAETSDGSNRENRFEGPAGRLIEVYDRLPAPGNTHVLYESYVRGGVAAASGTNLWESIAPAILGGLILLWLVQLPMAAQLARQLRRGQRAREALLLRSIETSTLERRRIARDLHDGAVQRLAATSYSLSAAARRMRADRRDDAASSMETAAETTRETIRDLRSMLVDLYPPTLQRSGLEAALADLLANLRRHDVATTLTVDPEVSLSASTEAVMYRVAQEALRNVGAHADATAVGVRVTKADENNVLEIVDDGRGFNPAAPQPERHFGLRMAADNVRELGGRFIIRSSPGRGTTIRLEVPA